jgi:hypothetical protein
MVYANHRESGYCGYRNSIPAVLNIAELSKSMEELLCTHLMQFDAPGHYLHIGTSCLNHKFKYHCICAQERETRIWYHR